ncbi:MAG: hypothetical protein P4L53_08305 [Candidatus Obscuribacterales bacterium]|nr:hypothetical protein [Candidatus Obscuribacterales bacterium]
MTNQEKRPEDQSVQSVYIPEKTPEKFDLLEFQRIARETCCPKRLFQLWEDICRRYDRNEIGLYHLEEMKEIIWPSLEALAILRRGVNETVPETRAAMSKHA